MMDFVVTVALVAAGAVVLVTIIYTLAPFRSPGKSKPSFVYLPKYETSFDVPPEAVRAALEALGFERVGGSTTRFDRGKIYGDFSARAIKLRVEIDPDRRTLKLYAPWIGVLFDEGDLWQIVQDVIAGAGHGND